MTKSNDQKAENSHPRLLPRDWSSAQGAVAENSMVSLPPELLAFVNEQKWIFAKTMPKWPHEYIVRDRVDEVLFEQLVRHIRTYGYEGKFYRNTITYYDEGEMMYWTMGSPIEETIIINRCRKENSYENRLRNGTLP